MAKSIRLNKQLRADIITNIMSSYDKANPLPVRPEMKGASIPELIKKMLFTKHKKVIEEFSTLSEQVLKYVELLEPNDYSQYRTETGHWESIYFDEEDLKDIKLPYSAVKGCVINLSDENQLTAPLRKAIEAKKKFEKTTLKEYKQKRKDHELERRNYIQQIQTVLDGVNTSNQLMEVWPEIEKFLPVGLLEPSKIQLPSVNIATLNSALIK